MKAELLPLLWSCWALLWLLWSRNVKTTTRHEPWISRCLHLVPLGLAGFLLWIPRVWPASLAAPLLTPQPWQYWAGVIATAMGLLLVVWARRHIGRNWSGTVTLKQDHELITSGPYAIVRHPIYTGLLLAFSGSGLARNEWRSVLAVALVFVALWRKLRIEECWMREQFGARYTDYCARVKALLPGLL